MNFPVSFSAQGHFYIFIRAKLMADFGASFFGIYNNEFLGRLWARQWYVPLKLFSWLIMTRGSMVTWARDGLV